MCLDERNVVVKPELRKTKEQKMLSHLPKVWVRAYKIRPAISRQTWWMGSLHVKSSWGQCQSTFSQRGSFSAFYSPPPFQAVSIYM